MKILIVENFWLGGKKLKPLEKVILNSFSILPTLYARQIAAITPKKHQVTLVDERDSSIEFEKKFDIVLINFNYSSAERAYQIADEFRKKKVPVIFSGWYPSVDPKEVKKHADSVLIGKNELTWLKLLEDFENKKLKEFYQPLKFDKSVKIPPTNVRIPGFVITGAIEATRGCPYKCDFCPEANLPGGTQYFTRPVEDVVKELRSIPQKTIMFYDSSLTIDTKYTKSLFKEMKKIKKKFYCNGNVDVLAKDKELVRLSKEAGCVSWLIGFESFSKDALAEVGKSTNKIEQYMQAVENIHENKMAVIGSFMFGFDSDSKDVFKTTLDMIKELKIDAADFCVLTPFPGTPVFDKLKADGRILTEKLLKYDMKNVVFQPKNMQPEELIYGVRKMYYEFYSTPYSIMRILRGLRLGIHPFFTIFARNLISNMHSRRLPVKK